MTRAIADTSIFIGRESGRALRADELPDELTISVITIGELTAGVLAATDVDTRAARLATLNEAQVLDPVPIDGRVAATWAQLRVGLRDRGHSMPVNDSWIAATAMALGVAVVSQDDDYADVAGLELIRI